MGHVVIATWKANPGEREKVMRILEDMTPGNRSEPKMLHFQAQVSTTDPDTIYTEGFVKNVWIDHASGKSVPLPRQLLVNLGLNPDV